MKPKHKLISLLLAVLLTVSVISVGTVSAAADELAPGSFAVAGEYTPSNAEIVTQRLLFAMPGAWQNDVTRDPRCGGAAGAYWWSGYDTPDAKFGHGWPGYKTRMVAEAGVDNLFEINVPAYGNGEAGNAAMLIWNNYLDGGMERDPVKNPFYAAAQQSRDFQCQFYSYYDRNETYDILFRWAFLYLFEEYGVDVPDLDIYSDTYWEDLNRLAADYLGNDYDRLNSYEKEYQADLLLDEMDPNDLRDCLSYYFGNYASNFFNEDAADAYYPKEWDSCGLGLSFTFDNMVFVVDMDPDAIAVSPLSGKASFGGEFYFYYGDGNYGSWPTQELNQLMGGVSGNFMSEAYRDSVMPGGATVDESTWNPSEHDANTIYFNAGSTNWKNFSSITCYLYEYKVGEIINWGSKKGKMTDEGNGVWSLDLADKGITLNPNGNYGCIFTADWGVQTCDLIIGADSMGDLAYCPGGQVENSVDSNKRSYFVKWASGKYGNPVCITAIGNVIGDYFWNGETAYSLFVDFLSSTGRDGIDNAVKYNGKTYAETINDTAAALGLSEEEVARAIAESGRDFDWHGTSTVDECPFVYEIYNYWGGGGFVELRDLKPFAATMDSVVIPEEIEGYPVEVIGDWMFYNNKYICYVEIPDTVDVIGTGAFYGCPNLTWVTLPDSVTYLGSNAFEKCLYLQGITLSANLTEIRDETFYDCRRLAYIDIPYGVTRIGEEAFFNCGRLRDLVLPETVTEIGGDPMVSLHGAFENCRSLQKIVLSDSVASLEDCAFEGCPNVTVSAIKGSYAAAYAGTNDIAFERMGGITKDGRLLADTKVTVKRA